MMTRLLNGNTLTLVDQHTDSLTMGSFAPDPEEDVNHFPEISNEEWQVCLGIAKKLGDIDRTQQFFDEVLTDVF